MDIKGLMDVSVFLQMLTPLIFVLSVVVEITPIQINPWKALFRYIAGIINKDVYKKLVDLEEVAKKNTKSISDIKENVETRFDNYEKQRREQQAVDMRSEIINFAENLKLGRIYSSKQFEYILGVTAKYYEHCERYGIKNHYIEEAHEFIRSEVRKRFNSYSNSGSGNDNNF